MTAVDLLIRCRVLGIDVAANADGTLLWEADTDPPAELLENLAVSKAAVVALLRKPTPLWDAVEAERLLAELRAEVILIEWEDYRGQTPAHLATLLRDALAIGARYVRDHEAEAARGWDALQLLRDLVPHVQSIARHFA